MDTFQKDLRKVQKRDWQLWSLMIFLFLISTSFIVLIIFYSDLQDFYVEYIGTYTFNFLLVGFVGLSLLFLVYIVFKEISIKKLQKDIVGQRIISQVLKQRLTELPAVLELIRLVTSEMVLSDVLDTICSKALETLDADQASLFLYDPQVSKLRCVSMRGGKDDRISEALVEVGKSVAGWVVEHGRPLHLDENLNEEVFKDFVKKDKKITSSLCVPLMVKDQPRGVLNITLFDKKKKFTGSDLKLASVFAENAAIAIDKAGLYEKLKKQTKTLKSIITDLKSSQGRLGEEERLRALSNLARGMSHDFNNNLTAILSEIKLLATEIKEAAIPENAKQNLLKCLSRIEQLASHGAETAKHIQKFTRTYQAGSERDFEKLDINAIVQEVVGITRPKWKDEAELKGIRIEMETELTPLLNPVGNHSEIEELLSSMIFNSIDALPRGGKIRIATKMQDQVVEIRVIDNGVGMNEETKNRVFEPFFTTKKKEGEGIGLSLALGIISRHKGEIKVESELGQGTTFTITLPVSVQRKTEKKKEVEITSPVT
jgi:signal transduction histidine kinase